MVVGVPSSGSLTTNGGTGTCVVPPGFAWLGAVTSVAVGGCSMPKLAFVTLVVPTLTATSPFTVPSLPVLSQQSSPVFNQPAGRLGPVLGALPIWPVSSVVLSCTV